MRILNAASRRALDLHSVNAEAAGEHHQVALLLDVNVKQVGQLYREWHSISDVMDVRSAAGFREYAARTALQQGEAGEWTGSHPPTSAGAGERARAALA